MVSSRLASLAPRPSRSSTTNIDDDIDEWQPEAGAEAAAHINKLFDDDVIVKKPKKASKKGKKASKGKEGKKSKKSKKSKEGKKSKKSKEGKKSKKSKKGKKA